MAVQSLGEREDLPVVFRGDKYETKRNWIVTSLLVSQGSVRSSHGIKGCVILSNGSVESEDWISDSIIVCDGDFRGVWLRNSIVIAGGNVRCERASMSVICTRQSLTVNPPKTSSHLNPLVRNLIREGARNPLGFVRYFETSDVGLEVAAADGGVRVEKCDLAQPPGKAGLRAGDVVTAVDGKPADSPEALRRLLRRATVAGETKLAVTRGTERLELTVAFPP
jgi:type II secretory pathway component PulC